MSGERKKDNRARDREYINQRSAEGQRGIDKPNDRARDRDEERRRQRRMNDKERQENMPPL